MDRRAFLLGFIGSLAVVPMITAASSAAEASSLSFPRATEPQPSAEPVISPGGTVDLEKAETGWSQYAYRRGRRVYRRAYRRTYRRVARRAYWRPYGRRCSCY